MSDVASHTAECIEIARAVAFENRAAAGIADFYSMPAWPVEALEAEQAAATTEALQYLTDGTLECECAK